jgi:hypothetical protein
MKKTWVRVAAGLALLYLLFLGGIFAAMKQEPEQFANFVARMPMPAMMLFPFESFWSVARAGALSPGQAAPDFFLYTADRKSQVRLSTHQHKQPVVLVFGSYT